MEKRLYIVLGLTPQGLSVVRTLARAGADVVAFCNSKKNVGYHSRYGRKILFYNIVDLKQYIGELVTDIGYKPVCYITSGELLADVLRDYKELYDICDVYSGPYDIVNMLAHKDRMYEYAVSCNLDIARYVTLDRYEKGLLRFPVFLKRNYEIPLFFKAVKVESEQDLQTYFDRIPHEHLKDVIVQEFINIDPKSLMNISCQVYCRDGKICGMLIADQVRRLRKGITACIREIEDGHIIDMVADCAHRFMDNSGYCGFAEFEFMYDKATGKLFFIEINTRTCGEHSAMNYKFVNLSEVLIDPSANISLISSNKPVRWINIQRDIRARLQMRDFSSLSDIFRSSYDVLDFKDIMPFFRQLI